MSALDLNTTLCDGIKVVLVQIDEMSSANLFKYTSLIRQFDDIELRQLTQTGRPSQELIPRRSRQDARVRFTFVDHNRYHPSPWTDLQLPRRVLGVIGIFHCESGDPHLSVAAQKFSECMTKFPSSLASICFAFEPREDQPDLDKAGGNVVMIPNTDAEHLSFYLSTLVQDFTARILLQLEKNTLAQSNVPYISTPRDSATTSDDIVKLKKKKPGRYLKVKGDAALLLGSPVDALEWYTQAVEQTRATNDAVWMAAALEGVASATLLQHTQWLTQPATDATYSIVAEKLREAVATYRRKKETSLEIELSVRTARCLLDTCERDTASELLQTVHAHSCAADGVSARNRALVAAALAQIHARMGRRRHAAMHARAAANAALSAQQPLTAHALLHSAAAGLQCDVPAHVNALWSPAPPPSTPLPDAAVAAARVCDDWILSSTRLDGARKGGWLTLQRSILQELAVTARHCNAQLAALRYTATSLERVAPYVLATTQQRLLDTLLGLAAAAHTPTSSATPLTPLSPPQNVVEMAGVPLLERLQPLPLESSLAAVSTKRVAAAASIFIVSPFDARNDASKTVEAPLLVADSPLAVRVWLTNPLSVPLEIDSIELSTCGVPFSAVSRAIELPPSAQHVPVVLRGTVAPGCERGGWLVVRGCHMRVAGVRCEHVVSPFGNGVSARTFAAIAPDIYQRSPVGVITRMRVLNPLPLLEAFVQSTNSPPGAPPFTLMCGESSSVELIVRNVGAMPVRVLDVSLRGYAAPRPPSASPLAPDPALNGADDITRDNVMWDDAELKNQLPLMPGQEITLTIQLFGNVYARGGDLLLSYASDVPPSDKNTNNDKENDKNNRNNNDDNDSNNNNDDENDEFSGIGAFGRHALVPMPVRIVESMQLSRGDVLPHSNNPSLALLHVELRNESRRDLIATLRLAAPLLTSSHEASACVSLAPGTSGRVVLPVRRLALSIDDMPLLREFDPNSKTFDRTLLTLTPRQTVALRRRLWYAAHVRAALQVEWSEAGSQRHGTLSLASLSLSGRALRALAVPHVCVACVVDDTDDNDDDNDNDDDDVQQRRTLSLSLNAFTTVTCVVRNIGSISLPEMSLDIVLYQDAENGAQLRQLDDILLVSGCLQRVVVPTLQPGEMFRHSLQLCALMRGSFYLESRVDAVPLSHLLAEPHENDTSSKLINWGLTKTKLIVK